MRYLDLPAANAALREYYGPEAVAALIEQTVQIERAAVDHLRSVLGERPKWWRPLKRLRWNRAAAYVAYRQNCLDRLTESNRSHHAH